MTSRDSNHWSSGKLVPLPETLIKGRCRIRRDLRCALCGEAFKTGDLGRFVYANGKGSNGCGNFFVCEKCDSPDALERGRRDFETGMSYARRWNLITPHFTEDPPGDSF
jgi:hypothetical protein